MDNNRDPSVERDDDIVGGDHRGLGDDIVDPSVGEEEGTSTTIRILWDGAGAGVNLSVSEDGEDPASPAEAEGKTTADGDVAEDEAPPMEDIPIPTNTETPPTERCPLRIRDERGAGRTVAATLVSVDYLRGCLEPDLVNLLTGREAGPVYAKCSASAFGGPLVLGRKGAVENPDVDEDIMQGAPRVAGASEAAPSAEEGHGHDVIENRGGVSMDPGVVGENQGDVQEPRPPADKNPQDHVNPHAELLSDGEGKRSRQGASVGHTAKRRKLDQLRQEGTTGAAVVGMGGPMFKTFVGLGMGMGGTMDLAALRRFASLPGECADDWFLGGVLAYAAESQSPGGGVGGGAVALPLMGH